MSYIFYDCSALKELILMNFNTENVTNMSCMFYDCFSLEEINFFNINTIIFLKFKTHMLRIVYL